MLEYRLDKKYNDKLGINIYRRRHKLYPNIVKFSKQVKNDGIYAENITRLIFDAVNLNHFHKNHPYVDLGVLVPIPQISVRNEIISIKSTINFKSTSKLLSDTKAVKIESLYSYILYTFNNYNVDYVEMVNSPLSLLNLALNQVDKNSEVYYKKIIQVTTYYLMFNNKEGIENDFISDIKKLINGDNELKYGNYEYYDQKVNDNISRLNTPISIGVCYIDKDADEDEGIVCIIKKTKPIKLNDFWYKIVDIWTTRKYFNVTNQKGKRVVKYLRYYDICDIYGIENSDDFPIQIKIATGEYKGENYYKNYDDEVYRKTVRMYIATKLKDANFKDKEYNTFRLFNKMIDLLESEPNLVTKFENFIKKVDIKTSQKKKKKKSYK